MFSQIPQVDLSLKTTVVVQVESDTVMLLTRNIVLVS